MKLKMLNIKFKTQDQLIREVKGALSGKTTAIDKKNELVFDSIESFKRFMSTNKLELLITISKISPESIYQLAKIVDRKYPHVLKDCRELEFFGFLKFVESTNARKCIKPELQFNYDMINVRNPVPTILPISSRSIQVLEDAAS